MLWTIPNKMLITLNQFPTRGTGLKIEKYSKINFIQRNQIDFKFSCNQDKWELFSKQ